MTDRVVLDGTCNLLSRLDGSCTLSNMLDGSAITAVKINDYKYYAGAYEVTPTDTAVVLNTADLMMMDNVTINRIPSNYGRIAWNGSTLTVS